MPLMAFAGDTGTISDAGPPAAFGIGDMPGSTDSPATGALALSGVLMVRVEGGASLEDSAAFPLQHMSNIMRLAGEEGGGLQHSKGARTREERRGWPGGHPGTGFLAFRLPWPGVPARPRVCSQVLDLT